MPGRSLRRRLALAGIVVALLAVLVTAYTVQRLTESTIRSALDLDLEAQRDIRDALAFHGAVTGDWDDVEREVEELALATGERIAVATLDGRLLADSAVLLDREQAPLPAQATIVDPAGEFFEVVIPSEDLERAQRFNDAMLLCLGAAGIAAEPDDLGLIGPDRPLTPAEEDDLLDCAADVTGDDDLLFEVDEVMAATEADLARSAPPLQLFIGYGDDREGLLGSGLSASFWLAVAAVVVVAVGITVLVADRITRPLAALTGAARSMAGGDLGARVAVTGDDEIADLGRAFNEMADSIEAEDRARRTLTTDVAHELRSPLANLSGYLEAIDDGVVAADRATIASLREEAAALGTLVDDLQQLSLAESGRLSLDRAPADLGDLVERTVAAHRPVARTAGVELAAATEPGAVVTVDGDRVRQILSNLVTNAVRHTPAGGRVDVVLVDGAALDGGGGGNGAAGPGAVAVEVRDRGEGIPAEHLPHLFDRFYRADGSRSRATGGSGLGLSIARELAGAHGGRIEVESEVGQGSTFRLVLPRA